MKTTSNRLIIGNVLWCASVLTIMFSHAVNAQNGSTHAAARLHAEDAQFALRTSVENQLNTLSSATNSSLMDHEEKIKALELSLKETKKELQDTRDQMARILKQLKAKVQDKK